MTKQQWFDMFCAMNNSFYSDQNEIDSRAIYVGLEYIAEKENYEDAFYLLIAWGLTGTTLDKAEEFIKIRDKFTADNNLFYFY